MAERKHPNKPWHDNPNHAGWHSHEMRKQAAEQSLTDYVDGDPITDASDINEVVLFNRINHQDNLSRLHGYFYKGTYYHHGVGQPNKTPKNENGRG